MATFTSGELPDTSGEAMKFYHPYTPYDVQLEFMKATYNVLEQGDGQVGIMESPTGTGKSLSLICAAVTWLRNKKRGQYEASLHIDRDQVNNEPEWMIDQMLRRRRDDLLRRWEEREDRLAKIRMKERSMEQRAAIKRRRLDDPAANRISRDEEDEFLLDDWSGQDAGASDSPNAFSKETQALLEKVGLSAPKSQDIDDNEPDDEIKIYYTSRTHSQLTQFVSELRKPQFPLSLPTNVTSSLSTEKEKEHEVVKHIPLSSRQKLCINPRVSRLASLSAINDRCSELQQPKSKNRCQFVPNADNLTQTHQFRDTALATLPDIEDMHQIGKSLQVCPYYASRTAIPGAEIITLPYPLLLQKSARDALGIKLEGNVVIIDEAHNIMDAIANVFAAEIRLGELRRARQMLGVYVKRFGKKLKGENRVLVARVAKVIDGLSAWLDSALNSKGDHGIVDSNALLETKSMDQIDLFELIKYIQESKLAFKVESYASHIEQEGGTLGQRSSSSPVLHTLVSFITALTNLGSEGRIFFEKIPGTPLDIKLSYLLLSPTHAFSSIATSARAVILAGGTMSPFDDYKAHLFPYLPSEKIKTLSCGHVIPPSNLCVWTLASSRPGGSDPFEFSFQKRSDRGVIRQLGLALVNVCAVVPDGVVVFFPSYGYLDEVVKAWEVQEENKSIWERLQARKAVFRETKSGSSDDVLQAYSTAILGDSTGSSKDSGKSTSKGALLLSVVGGKMSEGINFSDRLGRCVVIVGLPYPNINSPEWKARIEYVESSTLSRLTAGPEIDASAKSAPPMSREQALAVSKQAARDFYENACMRAVNQSIGRAIRHQNDYASIVLVDRRFGTERIRKKLPEWIRGGMVSGSEEKGLQGLMGALNTFFRNKKSSAAYA